MPRAETARDRQNQIEIADVVLWCNPHRYDGYIWLSAMNYRVDGCLFKRDGYAVPKLFFEAKQRTFLFGHYKDGYRISVGKLIAAEWLRGATNCPVALFAGFADGLVAGVDLATHNGLLIGGRRDRAGYPHDIEPMAQIDWGRFKIIFDPRSFVEPEGTLPKRIA